MTTMTPRQRFHLVTKIAGLVLTAWSLPLTLASAASVVRSHLMWGAMRGMGTPTLSLEMQILLHPGVVWGLTGLILGLYLLLSGRRLVDHAAPLAGGCPGCGYDTRGLKSEACPECGAPIRRPAKDAPPALH